jgi:ADP-ribose pyrophosphatase
LQTGERIDAFVPEPGITVDLATPAELVRMIKSGEFISQLHLGALLLAELRSFIALRS